MAVGVVKRELSEVPITPVLPTVLQLKVLPYDNKNTMKNFTILKIYVVNVNKK